MSHVVRPARPDELERAEALVVGSINDLCARHGFGQIASARPADFQAFCLQDDPRGVWTAEDDDGIAGFALSWTCGPLWFLAELFVRPAQQGRGIGNELIARTLQHASEAGCTEKSLITFAFNVVSQGLYVRHGLLPRVPLHLCSAEREPLARRLQGPTLRATPLRPTDVDLRTLADLDLSTLGVSREKHHRYLLGLPGMTAVLLHQGGECVGYAYVTATGHIGPLAVARGDATDAAFRTALAIAVDGKGQQVSAFVPGPSEALATAAAHGMRFTLPMVLMSSRGFGDWTRYLPRNPGFM